MASRLVHPIWHAPRIVSSRYRKIDMRFLFPGSCVYELQNIIGGKRMKKALALALLISAVGWANLAEADQIFTTPPGATEPNNGQSVSAMADFSISGTTLTIILTNTLPGIQAASQLLTDVFFTLSLLPTSPILSSQTGDLINVASDKTITDLGSSILGWGFGAATVNNLSGFELCVLCQGGPTASATPSEGILGPPSIDGKYDNANGSIAGNGPHNPFVNQTATFTITGIPTDATADNVIFSFSTASGDNVPGLLVPEPTSVVLLGTGLLALGVILRRRRKAYVG
jgi:hypothetical protein